MLRSLWLAFLLSPLLNCQTPAPDTLTAILDEIRQLRQDLKSMTLVSQRVQILLYRTQLQATAVQKGVIRHDEASRKLLDAEQTRAKITGEVKTAEEELSRSQDREKRAALEEFLAQKKRSLEIWGQDEQQYRTAEMEAAGDLKTEQTKLAELQQRLDVLEKQLEVLSSRTE